MQTFWKKTCRELYRRTTLTADQEWGMTDEKLEDTKWEETRPWEDQWETLKVNESIEFKRVTDTGPKYVSEPQKLVEIQHLDITEGLKRLFKDTQWTVV